MSLFPKDSDFGLTTAQADAVKDVLGAVARKKVALMKRQMRQMAAEGGARKILRFPDGNGGEVRMQIHPLSYHYWGNRLGYQCWEDPGFVREYLRDNPEARVKSVAETPTVIVQGAGGLASAGKKRFHKIYPHHGTNPTAHQNN